MASINKVSLACSLALPALAAVEDLYLSRTGRPTISRTTGQLLRHPWIGPVIAGALTGLLWHLTVEEFVPALVREKVVNL